jgi:uncharacterized protein
MTEIIVYYTLVILLIILNGISWTSTLFMFPGNWGIAAFSSLFYFYYSENPNRNLHTETIVTLVALAIAGELIEFFAGAWGAGKQGASRRAMMLAVAGTMAGSIFGTAAGIPVPIIGPIIGALGGGVLGAFAGAYLGESWKGRDEAQRISVGKGAMIGRLIGTFGKLIVGAIMFILVPCDLFFF